MASPDNSIPVDYLRQCFECDGEAGVLTWRERSPEHFATQSYWERWNARYAGKQAGSLDREDYLQVGLTFIGKKRHLRVQRIIWALAYGYWPLHEIDHINGRRDDNRLSNLREATTRENAHNAGGNRRNTSGFRGVCWHLGAHKWRAGIKADGCKRLLGYFAARETAFEAVLDACVLYRPFQVTPRDMNPAEELVEAAWWFKHERWRAVV